jgi:hypothetical protein
MLPGIRIYENQLGRSCVQMDDRHGESDMLIFGAFQCDRSKGNFSYSLLDSG